MSAPATYNSIHNTYGRYVASGRTAGTASPSQSRTLRHHLNTSASPEIFKLTDPIKPSDVQNALHKGAQTAKTEIQAAQQKTSKDWSFWDFLDIINPLHHIPIVGAIYRALSGDTIKSPARIAGGTLYGGPIGMAASMVNAMVAESNDGKDISETAIALLRGQDKPQDIQYAEQLNTIAPAAGTTPHKISAKDITWNSPRVSVNAAPKATPAPVAPVETQNQAEDTTPETTENQPHDTLGELIKIQEFNLSPLSGPQHTPTPLPSRGPTVMIPATQPHTPTPLPSKAVLTGTVTSEQMSPRSASDQTDAGTPTALLRAYEALASSGHAAFPPELIESMMNMALDQYRVGAAVSEETKPTTPGFDNALKN